MEEKALLYAEKYGIIDYEVKGSLMTYTESYPTEGKFLCKVDLNTMKEARERIL